MSDMGESLDDLIQFAEEIQEDEVGDACPPACWKLLVVDDDPDVHLATEHALKGLDMQGRQLSFLHARSADEAIAVLRLHGDVAVILLDVVMETEDAGLKAVERIRRELNLAMPRIILRTGQPGYVPEMQAIRDYDINDYKTKSELTRNKLFTTVLAAVRAYDQLRQLEAGRRGLEQVIFSSMELVAETSLNEFAQGVVRRIAAIIGARPEGLLFAPADMESDIPAGELVALAAEGRYQRWIHRPLSQMPAPEKADGGIRSTVQHCLDTRHHLFTDTHIGLYLPMRNNKHFLVYLEVGFSPSGVCQHLLDVFCANVAICAENIQLIGRLQDFAYFDKLVGLPNRAAFIQAVDRCFEEGHSANYSVALVDIDQFAEINNAFGHEYGDRLLVALADRLRASLARECMISRVSGDAFGVLGRREALDPARLRGLFDQPFDLGGMNHAVPISTGFVRLIDSGPNGSAVLKDASIARKLAREVGVNSDAYYSPEIGFQARERTRLLQQLKSAFDHDRLFAVFQPQIDLADGKLIGFEALMRWCTESGEFISPDRFIPLAEQSGLIVSMGAWILRDALHMLRVLDKQGWPGLRMAVNVSAIQFRMPEFIASVANALRDTGVAPDRLELEITESVAMMGLDTVRHSLQQLKDLGVSIAIDDFGTGFSSLSYLDSLPFDRIKIDRAFVNSMMSEGDGRRIAEVVIQLGHGLNLRVIAEGVETVAQADYLGGLGCHEAQGFLYGRPMMADQLPGWLQDYGNKIAG